MTPESQQRVLDFTSKLIATERDKYLSSLKSGSPGVSIIGGTLSVDPPVTPTAQPVVSSKMFPGRVLLGDRIRVVPFVVSTKVFPDTTNPPTNPTAPPWVVPTLRGRGLFESNPPSFTYISSGAAIYLVVEYQVESVGITSGNWLGAKAYVVAAEIVQVALDSPPPIQRATIRLTQDQFGAIHEVEIGNTNAKSATLLGVYGAGMVATSGVSETRNLASVKNFRDPLDGTSGPHYYVVYESPPVDLTYTGITV